MAEEHINLQKGRTGKIYGVTKMGANRTDMKAIRLFAGQGLNEHEIQHKTGVHFSCIRSFMKDWDPKFEPCDPAPNADTQHLHDRIKELEDAQKDQKLQGEMAMAGKEAAKISIDAVVSPDPIEEY